MLPPRNEWLACLSACPKLEDPRSIGQALKGSGLGDFRIIVDIQDEVLAVLVIRIGN
jgi:mRNA interferase RelE/StbE